MRSIRTTLSFLGILTLGLAACSDFKTGDGGMQYQIHNDKSGQTIKEGELAEVTLVEKTESDSVLWNSQDYDRPALLTREKSVFKGDLFAAIGMLSEGDSA